MDRKDFESLLKKYPDCVSDGKKLKAFLKDLYPDVPKAIVNTLTIMADDGIIAEMQMPTASSSLVSVRLRKKLEDDYGLSQNIISDCFLLIAHKNIKFTESVQDVAYDSKDFEIVNGVLKKYKGNSSVVVIPNSVTSIGKYAFDGCSNLQDIYITDIAAWCNISGLISLMRCGASNKKLYINNELATSITIPNGVKTIPSNAFCGCSGLTSITIPNSVTSIGDDAFRGCSKLQDIYITDIAAWCHISGLHNLMSYYGANNKNLYLNNELATSITIPDGVTKIGMHAFEGCTGLTSVTIPDSITSIGYEAFKNCSGLTSITIPDSVTSIGDRAFSDCTGLTSVTIGNGVTSIGYEAFYGCTGLTSVTIPDSVTNIGSSAFYGCTGLTSVTIPNGVKTIPSNAFCGCSGLTSITIPNSVTSIGDDAFRGCEGLTSIIIPDSVTSIGAYVFYGCTGLTSITIPNSVTSIGKFAFWGCEGLTSVIIGNSVTSIGDEAFSGCRNLTIYCEAESKPIGWSSDWNPEHRPVVWGVKNKT